MIAYRYDDKNNYAGVQTCQRDPIASAKAGKDIYLLPGNCTYIEPAPAKEGYNIKGNGEAWEYVEIPKEPEPEPHVPTIEEKIAQLDSQYQSDKQILQEYYLTFFIIGDTEGMAEIKQELADLAVQYDASLSALKGEE